MVEETVARRGPRKRRRAGRRAGRGARWLLVLLLAVVVLVGGGFLVVGHDGGSEAATPIDGPLVTEVPPSTVPAPVPPRITAYVSPEQPTAVGVRTLTVTDPTRGTEARGDRPELPDRPLRITVRYPTPGMPGDDEIADAPAYEPAPLVLFAHGYDISASRYSLLQHDLASYGFVVVAPEFPMSSTEFEGAPDEYDIPEQARDLSFLITALTGPAAPPELAGLIAPGDVGLVGHSDGAVTVLLAAYAPRFADPRVGAVVAISGDFDTFGGRWFTTNDPPLVAVHGEWDEINPFDSSQELVDNDPGPAMLVGVQGSTHLAAATDPENATAVARLAAYDFLWRLDGLPGAEYATYEVASTPPLELVTDHA